MQLRKGCRLWWIVPPTLALDRISKLLALRLLAPDGVIPALPGVFSWAYTENRGAAFSMLSGNAVLLPLTAVLIAAVLIWLLRHPEAMGALRAGLWLILGGGLGNLYDRIRYGFVVDFIRLDFINFAIFNLADVFVSLGAALVVLGVVLQERRQRHG